ncbi:MAG: Calx-beta domain-containing protein, partial [Desulfobacteraceae bacterium]
SLYTAASEDVDQYMWDHKDYLIVFSAGSHGMDMDGDGVVDQFRIDSPATAKNCLTVGASEGYQPSGAGLDLNWGDNTTMWQYWFTADPIASDHVSDNYDGMAAISARGPTLDGRTKPDLVAPGSNILSTRSSQTADPDAGWGAFDAYYMWNGGTSSAAPLTAGAAAVMRQYLMEIEGIATPSAALIKAALLNSAEDISPGQYAGEIPQVPSSVAGWGRLNLGNAIHPTAPLNILYYDEKSGLATGEFIEYVIQVSDASEPLKLNLVWTDFPGTPYTQGGLVNDLDLQVTDPASAVHYPDQAAQQSTITTMSYDDDLYSTYNSNYSHAMRFTPSGADTYLDSVTFAFYNSGANGGADGNVDVVVYPDNGSGRPDATPGNEIFRKTLSFAPWTMITIPVNIDIGSDEFHIAIEDADTANLGLYVDAGAPSDGRSSYYNGSTWLASSITPYIRANMRSANPSDTFDRVNNVVGITIDAPVVGEYTVRVSGFNVPEQGPQPYALIARGNIVDTNAGTIQFESATFSVDESGGSATITATRSGGSDGAVSVSYSTSDGTASAGSDYAAASGTLTWADGDSADKTFSVSISDDSSSEADETVNMTLTNASNGSSLGGQNATVLTIVDNDTGGSGGGGGGCFIQSLR